MNRVAVVNYTSEELNKLRELLLFYLEQHTSSILLDSNTTDDTQIPVTGISYDLLGGFGVKEEVCSDTHTLADLQEFIDRHRTGQHYIFGYFSYDLKNEFEKLSSSNPDHLQFPLWHFFVPETLFIAQSGKFEITTGFADAEDLLNQIREAKPSQTTGQSGRIVNFPDRIQYTEKIEKILHHIQRGDIYEMNYCEEIRVEDCDVNPVKVYESLTRLSPNPFSAYYAHGPYAIACASPERFMTRRASKIISQPMKGTMPRSEDAKQDQQNKKQLQESHKERSENVMITDLVRNDLSRIAKRGSVKVEDLFGVYRFKRSWQMITTVSCEVDNEVTFTDILKALFPMGSMTGAPKISAMQLIEQLEEFRRGIFSGSIGYIAPDGDFDFNVIIRSIAFNRLLKRASVAAGGAITFASDPEKEFEEMMLKLRPQLEGLGVDNGH
jgi:para-aminobenzoate synthetase component 1